MKTNLKKICKTKPETPKPKRKPKPETPKSKPETSKPKPKPEKRINNRKLKKLEKILMN